MEAVFRRTRVITADEIDQLGHVNNIVWIQLALELTQAHYTAAQVDLAAHLAAGGVWVVRHHDIWYRRSAVVGDELLEETWVSVMRGAQSVRHCRFTRTSDDLELVCATTQWAWVDPKTQRPKRVPADLIACFPEAPPP